MRSVQFLSCTTFHAYHVVSSAHSLLPECQTSDAYQVWRNFVELGNAYGCGLSNIRICVLQSSAQRLAKILADLFNSNATHGAYRQGTNKRIGVSTILDEAIDSHNCEVWLSLGIIDEVQVHQLADLHCTGGISR